MDLILRALQDIPSTSIHQSDGRSLVSLGLKVNIKIELYACKSKAKTLKSDMQTLKVYEILFKRVMRPNKVTYDYY